MTNQGGEYIVELDSNSVEKRQIVDVSQGNASTYASLNPGHYSWPSSTGPVTVSWNFHRADNNSVENGTPSSSSYHYDTQREVTASRDAQDGISAAPHASTSSSQGAANATQNYGAYASYSNSTNPYGYYNSEYQNYYYGYQTPASDPSSQQVGASQNSGAPYQSLSSFQNTGSYAGPASYSDTYYNTGDHQTMGGYQSSSYNQTNLWNDGNCGSYPLPYSNYTSSDTNSIQSTSTVSANSIHYQQQYNQWPEHHSSTAPNFGCAPGTENTSMTTTTAVECPVQSVGGGYPYPYPTNQPPPPGTTSWRTDSGSSGLPSIQGKNDVTGYNLNDGWKVGAPGFQNHHINQMASHFQKPLDSNPLPHDICGDQQNQLYPQGSSLQFSSINQVPENFQPPLQTAPLLDTPRVSKMQIQTNPRIASSLAFGMPKTDKESSTTNTALKPAYVSIASPNLNSKVSSHYDSEAMMKVTFPPSLRTYVERTLARCKDDVQRAANQNIMKEMITKASGDGTLFTRNWDMEPLFPLPNTTSDMVDQNNLQTSGTLSSLPKYKRSPSRRTKSRWEPMPEEKLVEKLSLVNHDSAKDVTLGRFKETERMADSGKSESKDNGWNGMKFLPSQQQAPSSKIAHRPVKKQRFGEISNLPENGDASSDSDKEQGLTKYYSSAITLANSPEEKKKREYRFKRFEKVQVHQTEIQHLRPKVPGAGNICTRRASTAQLAKRYEDGCSRAVEDIDWDALTVKGTCQEVEKRYLRLTSAPDPATVRPEEVLEKALQMVQSSQKNYLYKCDQLKSIRQDLTVQRIQNELTVKVYETHARLALEAGDLPEYNQCQSKLKSLYAEGIKGCHMEFSAYHLLCIILHSSNNRELLSSMTRLSTEAKKDEAIKHALAVRTAVSSGNYILFFRLYKMAPNLNTCLMDLYVEKMRFEAVRCLSKSYRPTVPLTFIAQVLGFSRAVLTDESEETDKDGLEECEEWLRAHGANLVVDNNGEMQLDTKVTSSSLYMPDPEDAVAHGDTTLAVDDFLTRTS